MKIFIPFLFLTSSIASAFTLNSTNQNFRGWQNPELKFAFNLSNCPASVDVRGIVGEALDLWNNVPTSNLKLTLVEDTTSSTEGDPIPIICDTNYGAGSPGAADGSPGMASISTSGNYISKGIMYLNASSGRANIGNLTAALVAVTLAHEMGHLIGVGHSQDLNALMYYDASLKTDLNLAQDDVDAVTYLYPRNELSNDKLFGGCGLISNQKSPPWKPNLPLLSSLMLLPLGLGLYLRKRRRHNFFAETHGAT